jgi:hypothetical protein
MGVADLIPDRRRNHFPLNGGPRPSDADKERGHRGAENARSVLDAAIPTPPATTKTVIHELGSASIGRARTGIKAARAALRRTDDTGHERTDD